MRVLKLVVVLLGFMWCPYLSIAQDTAVVHREANIMAQATFKGDYKTVIAYTYPKLIDFSGGSEGMQKLITDRVDELKKQGILSIVGTVGPPGNFYKAGLQVHCLLPEELYIHTSAGRYRAQSWLLGVSSDEGKSWTFLDVGNMPADVLRKLLPNFNNNLLIPAPVPPEFLPN